MTARVALAIAVFVTFSVWLTPANKYALIGITSVPPDPDTGLMLVVLSLCGCIAAAVALWRATQWWIRIAAGVVVLYDVYRFLQAAPYFSG